MPDHHGDGGVALAPARHEDFVGIAELDSGAWAESAHPDRVPDGEHVWRIWVDDAFVFVARDATGSWARSSPSRAVTDRSSSTRSWSMSGTGGAA